MVVKIPLACCFCISNGVCGSRPSHVPKRLTGGGNPDGAHIVIAWVGCIGPRSADKLQLWSRTNEVATEITTQEDCHVIQFHLKQITYRPVDDPNTATRYLTPPASSNLAISFTHRKTTMKVRHAVCPQIPCGYSFRCHILKWAWTRQVRPG